MFNHDRSFNVQFHSKNVIEGMRMLMVKMSQRRHVEERKIYINKASEETRSSRRQVTREYFQSKAIGALQHKKWKPRKLQSVTTR